MLSHSFSTFEFEFAKRYLHYVPTPLVVQSAFDNILWLLDACLAPDFVSWADQLSVPTFSVYLSSPFNSSSAPLDDWRPPASRQL